MLARSSLIEIVAQVSAPSGLRHRKRRWSKRVDRLVAVAPQVTFGRAPLPCSRRVCVRANISEEWPGPDGIRPQWLVPRRAATCELFDRRLPVLGEQEIRQFAHVAHDRRTHG